MTSDAIAAFGPDNLRRVERLLGTVTREAGARCALLLDRRGQASFASPAVADFQAGSSDDAGGEIDRLFAG